MTHVFSCIRFCKVCCHILINKMPVSLSESPISIHAYVIHAKLNKDIHSKQIYAIAERLT